MTHRLLLSQLTLEFSVHLWENVEAEQHVHEGGIFGHVRKEHHRKASVYDRKGMTYVSGPSEGPSGWEAKNGVCPAAQ